MGEALAKEFHKAGLHVYATARDVNKMKSLSSLSIETLPLDVHSEESIKACVEKLSSLDILINNAGASYMMPLADVSLSEAKKLFDTNVWGCIATTQAFLPLLLKSKKAIIANHTSIGADMCIPFQGVYNASKAAMSMFSETLRLELQPFDITVVNLKTGSVESKILDNVNSKQSPKLPENSIYSPARDVVESTLRGDWVRARSGAMPAETWAKGVVADLLKQTPPSTIWRGGSAWLASWLTMFPGWMFDGMVTKMTGLDKAGEIVRRARRK